jgi:iron complex transport system ATP-binding protein
MLEARGVSVAANGHTLLAAVDIALRPGRVTVLIGPNGAGKSTLLRALAGELRPTQGAVRLDGRDLAAFTASELARRRGVVPQASLLAFPFTALEVVILGVTVPGFETSAAHAQRAALEALEALGLSEIAHRPYVHLSGGERQRVHIARVLCQLGTGPVGSGETRYLLLDEPTSSLDLAHQMLALDAIRREAERGLAVLAVLHDLNLAAALADDMVLLVRGRVAAAGRVAEVLKDDLLSAAYGCPVRTNRKPDGGRPFVLPPAVFASSAPGTARRTSPEQEVWRGEFTSEQM